MANKLEIISFKVDASLAAAMKGMPNRSDFLRAAVLAALENTCPLCKGTGLLTPQQMEHWREFAKTHSFEECGECHEYRLVCSGKHDHCHHGGKAAGPAKKEKQKRH